MSGNPLPGAPASQNGPPPPDPYARQQNYGFNGRILLMAAFLLFALTLLFTVIRFCMYMLVARSGGRRRRRGSFAAGILRSINSFGAGASGRRGLDASALSALPVTAYRKEGAAAAAGGADCAVCLSELADGDKVRELSNCGHSFHVECVDAWLRSRTTCPLCRAEAELPKGNGKAESSSAAAAAAAAATEPPQPALFGGGGTLIVTVQGGFLDAQRDARASTSGLGDHLCIDLLLLPQHGTMTAPAPKHPANWAGGGEDGPSTASFPMLDDMTNMICELEQELKNVLKVSINHLDMAVVAKQEQVQHAEDCMAHIGRLTEEVDKMKAVNLVLDKENTYLNGEIERVRKEGLINGQDAMIEGNKCIERMHEFGLRIRRQRD